MTAKPLKGEDMKNETQKTVVVTGGSRGIGAHIALAFARQGWSVVVLGRSLEGLAQVEAAVRNAGHEVLALTCDVTDEAAVGEMVAQVQASRPSIDVVVNSAGLIEPEVPLWESDADQWWQVMETNVRGPFLVTRAIAPVMIAHGGGRFINLNSGAATRESAVLTAYNASKSALARITGGVAAAGAEHGVHAFDLAPGVIDTDMTRSMAMHEGRTSWTDPDDVTDLALAIANGELDDFSGRMVRAGADTPASLRAAAKAGLPEGARTIRLRPWGDDDPLA